MADETRCSGASDRRLHCNVCKTHYDCNIVCNCKRGRVVVAHGPPRWVFRKGQSSSAERISGIRVCVQIPPAGSLLQEPRKGRPAILGSTAGEVGSRGELKEPFIDVLAVGHQFAFCLYDSPGASVGFNNCPVGSQGEGGAAAAEDETKVLNQVQTKDEQQQQKQKTVKRNRMMNNAAEQIKRMQSGRKKGRWGEGGDRATRGDTCRAQEN